ncbi:MAG: hypothetical protein ABSE82_02610 [Nitrososphaerales archaeon]
MLRGEGPGAKRTTPTAISVHTFQASRSVASHATCRLIVKYSPTAFDTAQLRARGIEGVGQLHRNCPRPISEFRRTVGATVDH